MVAAGVGDGFADDAVYWCLAGTVVLRTLLEFPKQLEFDTAETLVAIRAASECYSGEGDVGIGGKELVKGGARCLVAVSGGAEEQ